MLELTLIRHGETDYNAERRMQGHLDIPLNERGLWQAKQLAMALKGQEYDYLYSSDLARAFVTAKTCFPNRKIFTDKRLRERCYGEFEGKVFSNYSEAELRIYQAYKQDPFTNKLTGGEDSFELFSRIQEWLMELPKQGKAIVFTHGGVIRSLIRAANGRNAEIGPIENTSRNYFLYENNKIRVISLNNCKHLRY